jgi:hypothetical protein
MCRPAACVGSDYLATPTDAPFHGYPHTAMAPILDSTHGEVLYLVQKREPGPHSSLSQV